MLLAEEDQAVAGRIVLKLAPQSVQIGAAGSTPKSRFLGCEPASKLEILFVTVFGLMLLNIVAGMLLAKVVVKLVAEHLFMLMFMLMGVGRWWLVAPLFPNMVARMLPAKGGLRLVAELFVLILVGMRVLVAPVPFRLRCLLRHRHPRKLLPLLPRGMSPVAVDLLKDYLVAVLV